MPAVLAPVIAGALLTAGVPAAVATPLGTILAYAVVTGAAVGSSHLLRRSN